MIYFFAGENSFEVSRAVKALADSFDGAIEKFDGTELDVKDLPNLLMGMTLFSDKRLVIVKDASSNTTLWSSLPDWIERLSDDITLVLAEGKPDKRTTVYKTLKANSAYQEFASWTDRDRGAAENWVQDEAKVLGINLDRRLARVLVDRVGVDQWMLHSSLEKLSLLPTVSEEGIVDTIDAQPTENVFNLFEAALSGKVSQLQKMIRTLELSEDPYRLFALLSSQAFQLAVIHAAGRDDNPAKDFGIHPFVVSKLSGYARTLNKADIRRIITAFANSDGDMKSSSADPWMLIERALLTVTKNSP